ncbi:MAG: energy-coupling factor transporter transmembrane protein EcfT [Clostridia bacterium]|nr:energy-coupling factor transporter transmembrane protein EcfT [Clostridia bacterium]
MLKDVTFGQFYPARSFVHKMDPRVKILIIIAYIVFIFLIRNFFGFLPIALFLTFAIAFSRVPIASVLRSIRAILVLVIFAALLNLLLYGGSDATVLEIGGVRLKWLIFSITDKGLISAAFMSLRLILLVLGTCLLTLTTTPMDLTEGIESLLTPLKWVRFPVHELALIMSIALRFIPTLMEETDRIVNAQKSRGADFESGNIFSRMGAMVPILIPLLVSAFRRAEELGDAMDSRCYSGAKGRTKYKVLKVGLRDLFGTIFAVAVFAGIILLNIYLPGVA